MSSAPLLDSYRARRRLEITAGNWREPEELVPEAHTWFMLDSWLHTGNIVETKISEQDLRAAIAQYCPELKPRLLELTGLDPDVDLNGAHKSPVRRARKAKSAVKPDPGPDPDLDLIVLRTPEGAGSV